MSIKIHKNVITHMIFNLPGLYLKRFMENLCIAHPVVIAFMVRYVMALNGILSIFPLGGIIIIKDTLMQI